MKTIEVTAEAAVEPVAAYEYLLDFTNYADFCRYVDRVTVETDENVFDGDQQQAGPGTKYRIRLGWWRLSVNLRAEISQVDRPEAIKWQVLSDVDAHGRWEVQPSDSNEEHSQIRFIASYDAAALSRSTFDLPPFVPMARVIDRLMPLMKESGRNVFEQIVWDLEGSQRPVEVTVRTGETH